MALIFETLNNITQDKGVKVHRDSEGFMHLEGVFGVCNKMNNNRRVYHTDNYRKMVEGLQERIFGHNVIGGGDGMLLFILPPGGFICLGLLMALISHIRKGAA